MQVMFSGVALIRQPTIALIDDLGKAVNLNPKP
jgi:hypothetical protein